MPFVFILNERKGHDSRDSPNSTSCFSFLRLNIFIRPKFMLIPIVNMAAKCYRADREEDLRKLINSVLHNDDDINFSEK